MKNKRATAYLTWVQLKRCRSRLSRLSVAGRNLRKQIILRRREMRLQRAILRLLKGFNPGISAAAAAALFIAPEMVFSQQYIEKTGTANPMNGVDVGYFSAPAAVDIDADGDKDKFIGDFEGNIHFYKNEGSASAPVFVVQTGASNPFNGINVGNNGVPAFCDIDNDGDQDVFIGTWNGTIRYYKNTGSTTQPVFSQQTGSSNPLNGVDPGQASVPAFVDVDGDGDLDAFIGAISGLIYYYKNTGTAALPVFSAQTGSLNPLNGADAGEFSAPAFADIDLDGDRDAAIGSLDGTLMYYKNTGTQVSPVFSVQTGSQNPLGSVGGSGYSVPVFADTDGDGDPDLYLGEEYGNVMYYQCDSEIPSVRYLGDLSVSGSRCYDALQTIVVAGNRSTFTVMQGGTATLQAGLNIKLMPGTTVKSGGYLIAKITPGGPWCQDPGDSFVLLGPRRMDKQMAFPIRVFPNPTKGDLEISWTDFDCKGICYVEIFSPDGVRIMSREVVGKSGMRVSLHGYPEGIYPLLIRSGDDCRRGRICVSH